MHRWLVVLLLLSGTLHAARWRAGLVGGVPPELKAGILESVRDAVEIGGGTFLGGIELTGGSLGYGLPVCRDADFVLRVALTHNPLLDIYFLGLEAASVGSGELFGIADAGFYPPGEFLRAGVYVGCAGLMTELPPFGRAEESAVGVEVGLDRPLAASRPALVYRCLDPGEEPTFPYLGSAVPLALVQLPPDAVRADVPLVRGELEDGELYVVVVDETTAEELARKLDGN
jgi:hypothetical protein